MLNNFNWILRPSSKKGSGYVAIIVVSIETSIRTPGKVLTGYTPW